MSFIETPRFPDDISAGSKYGPAFSTRSARNHGGYRAVNRNWTYPLHKGDVMFGVRNQSQMDSLLAYFHGSGGMFNGFRFKDWKDYSVSGSAGTLIAIDSTHWQMAKTYIFGALSTQRKIQKPLSTGISVSGGGVYTYSYTTGIITKTGGADPTGWEGEFDNAVAFDIDEMLPQWLSFENFEISSLPITEIRL